jgi:hypothetical protein
MAPLHAQPIPRNTSSLTWGLGFGSGSYTGIASHQFGSVTGTGPGTVSFTRLATAFRLMFATDLLDSRLSIGVDYAFQQIEEGSESEILVGVQGPDAAMHSVFVVGDYVVSDLSDGVRFHTAGGLGILFFAFTTTRIEYNDQMGGFPQEFQDANVQLAASGRLLLPIQAGESFTIDPEVRFLASTGGEKVMLVQFLVGLTYRW